MFSLQYTCLKTESHADAHTYRKDLCSDITVNSLDFYEGPVRLPHWQQVDFRAQELANDAIFLHLQQLIPPSADRKVQMIDSLCASCLSYKCHLKHLFERKVTSLRISRQNNSSVQNSFLKVKG